MGSENGQYQADFPIGAMVQIVGRDALERFRDTWQFHHPLEATQLAFAGQRAVVRAVGFYNGGDELHNLEGVPGTWHQRCLHAVVADAPAR